MVSTVVGDTVDEVIASVLDPAPEEIVFVNPSPAVLKTLVETVVEREHRPRIRLLGETEALKAATDDFVLASNVADLIESGDLSARTAELSRTSLFLTPDRMVSLVAAGDLAGGLATGESSFVDAVRETYEGIWESAEEFSLRTPAMSRIRDTLADAIGPAVEEDFESMLAAAETARGNDGLDEVVISLLVAAKNEVLLYDISRWGEDVGIASKATFSRTKSRLEEHGLIDTEKVPIDVGRPRLRLKLADDRLGGADVPELASVAGSVLAS